ncbi:hypothetical protein ACFE04_000192 [Oxalis oulophora]
MARTGIIDSDPTVMAKSTELLKKELHRLVRSIIDDEDDYDNTQIIDQAKETLTALKDVRLKTNVNGVRLRTTNEAGFSCPDEFRCPLSKQLMKDPVILATGQTYDRPFIEKWLKTGNRTCPQTKQVLSHSILTPNNLVREMIAHWCKTKGIELPNHVKICNDEGVTEVEIEHFQTLLQKMSAPISEQKAAAKELRSLTKKTPSFRALFGESTDAIPKLLSPLTENNSPSGSIQPDLQEDVITTLLNLSIHDSNKKLVAETPMVIPLLIEALRSGIIETRTNAAAAFFTLSALDSNKALIGRSGAIKPLIELLEEGHPLAMKDVASALFNLCILHDNRARAVRDGAVSVIVKKIIDGILVDELLAILAMLSNHQKAVEEMGELGTVNCLLRIIREGDCGRKNENCIAILHTICLSDRSKWKEIREEEKNYRTLSKLAEDGTSRAKRKASGILERLRRAANFTNTA